MTSRPGSRRSPAPRPSTCSPRSTGCASRSAGRPTASTAPGSTRGSAARRSPSGGLLKHLAAQEDHNSTVKLTGEPLDPVWDDNGWDEDDDWEFTSAADDSPEELYALYDGAVLRARERYAAALADGGLDREIAASFGPGQHANLRRLLFDMLEEYGRHTGQADLLREAVDGRVGEDPPADWRSPIVSVVE